MNISTGGPHILLFERDQQLTALLVSELQLAGYTSHTARTAVEVFDAIARHPIRLVLVNLAQAAAARREFWVALDSQRRDRKVQVLTFLCTNLAGYGPRDFEERPSSTIADIEVDGMMGLMHLVEAVRARVPNEGLEANASTLPRIPKVPPTPSSSTGAMPTQRSQQPIVGGSTTTAYRSTATDIGPQPTTTRTYATPLPPSTNAFAAAQSQPASSSAAQHNPYTTATPPTPAQQGATAGPTGPTGYTEKIRAVLYPNQRTWSSQNGNNHTLPQENREAVSPAAQAAQRSYSASVSGPSDSALQRLANGQGGQEGESNNESGLAQLSRMAQGYRSPLREEEATTGQGYTTTAGPLAQPTNTRPGTASPLYQTTDATQPVISRPASASTTYTPQTDPQGAYPVAYPPVEVGDLNTPPHTRPAQTHEGSSARSTISEQTLRASPIQDMPIERTMTGPAITETTKRPDVLSRSNYGQQLAQIAQQLQAIQQTQAAQPAPPPLASIATPMPPTASANRAASPTASTLTTTPAAPQMPQEEGQKKEAYPRSRQEAYAENETQQGAESDGKDASVSEERHSKDTLAKPGLEADSEGGLATNNAVLLDIVQSLPPMPALAEQPQSVQPQVLSGRATRSLGQVLLDGHLVPHDRLEVAQNIQRMLRGVDLNYQLGEILLMFKLLTPDQLLAASLVSYGLITTTQISALGRIRQELHAIGLEYDLENLLVLFRILTPEQLREVRASLQS